MNSIQQNLDWIKSGKIGCTFASYFARMPELVGWQFQVNPVDLSIPEDCLMLSLIFPEGNIDTVKNWALKNGFYLENVGEGLIGLRYNNKEGVSWVQYFGLDAPVKTRQAPVPMLMMCVKLPVKSYFKVGFNGILHIANTEVKNLSDYVANKLWETSHSNTTKQLGHPAGLREAAKTTYHE